MRRLTLAKQTDIQAAGLLLQAPSGAVLFLRRVDTEAPDCWAFPGGKIEAGEAPLDAAIRETQEEIKFNADPDAATEISRTKLNGVTFTTFRSEVDKEFIPELNEEHNGFAWAQIDSPHSPCTQAL